MNKLLFATLVLYMSIDTAQPSRERQPKHPNDWDILIFTQEWPETVCKEWVHKDPSHTCNMPKKTDDWSIHGVWPTKYGTKGPGFCNRTWHFDPEQVRGIESMLEDKWTNIEGETEKYSFWAHEWTKHGTCAAVLPSLNSEFKYFSQGLFWGHMYDMSKVLASNGIVPDDHKLYHFNDIQDTVKSQVGFNPSIQCRKEDGISYLVEIRICFDKALNKLDCDGILHAPLLTNCDVSQGILYPHNKWPANSIYVELFKLVSWAQWFSL